MFIMKTMGLEPGAQSYLFSPDVLLVLSSPPRKGSHSVSRNKGAAAPIEPVPRSVDLHGSELFLAELECEYRAFLPEQEQSGS